MIGLVATLWGAGALAADPVPASLAQRLASLGGYTLGAEEACGATFDETNKRVQGFILAVRWVAIDAADQRASVEAMFEGARAGKADVKAGRVECELVRSHLEKLMGLFPSADLQLERP